MKVVDGDWTPKGVILTIACECGEIFKHPTWKRRAKCPKCGARGDLIQMKSEDANKVIGKETK